MVIGYHFWAMVVHTYCFSMYVFCSKLSNSVVFEVLDHTTSLTRPLFIKMSIPDHESEWSCICVLYLILLNLY